MQNTPRTGPVLTGASTGRGGWGAVVMAFEASSCGEHDELGDEGGEGRRVAVATV